jgi:DNA-directed RNA polymerase subunit RPC12/RpoP
VSGEDERGVDAESQAADWPRCAYCGSLALHESRRGGFQERLLRASGAALYRCETCGRRFAFVALGHPHRHRRARGEGPAPRDHRTAREADPRREERRHTMLRLLVTVVAALLTFVTAAWLISRAERRSLEGEGIAPPSDPQ